MNSKHEQPRRHERGSMLIFVTCSLLILFGFMGLAFDASYFYFVKRRMQTAADAGALGGAQELLRGNASAVVTAAQKDSALNRFADAANDVTVSVSNPPVAGPHQGNTGFVEVVVSQRKPSLFMSVLNFGSTTIRARAVAGITGADGCVYALNRDLSNVNNGFFANGTTNSNFACGVYSNAHFRTVGGGCVVTPSASYSGDYTNSSSTGAECGPSTLSPGVPVVDPLAGRYAFPEPTSCVPKIKVTSGPAVTLQPGVYCGGIEIGGSVPAVTFSPGLYVLAGGGLKIGSGVNATGTGVTFVNTYPASQISKYDGIVINTSGTVTFTAPTSGAYAGLLFYQNPSVSWSSNNGSIITASATSVFQGILYFPTTDLTYSGNSTSSGGDDGYTMLIGYNVKISGNAKVNSDYSALAGGNPLRMAAFVE